MARTSDRDHSSDEFVPRRLEPGSNSGYCIVMPRRLRDTIPSAPPEPVIAPVAVAALDLEPNHDFEEMTVTIEMPRPDEIEAPMEAAPERSAFTEYRDPDLCSCGRMGHALATKIVMVVVAGPVTLPPALMTEEAMLAGRFNVDRVDQAYDGKLWAFRYCPFEDEPIRLIDDQVPASEKTADELHCCRTMEQAVTHGRVQLPEPDKHAHASPMFVSPGNAGTIFTVCPWCATSAFDLGLARFKRHLASRNP